MLLGWLQAEDFSKFCQTQFHKAMPHPVLGRVRQCSSRPESAALFFGELLWPWEDRISAAGAQKRLWLKGTRQEMDRDQQQANMQGGKVMQDTPHLSIQNPFAFLLYNMVDLAVVACFSTQTCRPHQ